MANLKTKYKHIFFEAIEHIGTSTVWICRNNKTNARLGVILKYAPWRQWIFEGMPNCVFSVSCLTDIIDFIKQLKD
jgi:hypothetical protein